MKTILYFLTAGAAMLMACSDSKKIKLSSDTPPETVTEAMPQQECYTYIKNRDTVTLSITPTDSTVTGNLSYQLFEKDKNTGTVSGKMLGDTILLDYTFQSEGVTSKRQVAYLKLNDTLVEGFADSEEKNNAMVFKNRSDLRFEKTGIVLKKAVCK